MIKHSVNYSYLKNGSKALQADDKQTEGIMIIEIYKLKFCDGVMSTKSTLQINSGVFLGIKAFDGVQRKDLKGIPQCNTVNFLCISG